jgi:hypothetical protein
VRLLFGQSLSSGYGVGSPDRLFGFSSYSKRFSVRGDSLLFSFFLEEGGFFVCRTRSGFGLLDFLDRTERNWSFCVTFWISFLALWSFEFLPFFASGKKAALARHWGFFQCCLDL